MKKLLLVLLILLATNSFAQVLTPAKWDIKLSTQKAKIGETIDVILVATLEKSWHLYAMKLPPDVALPTTFKFVPNASFSLVGETKEITKPITKFDKTWDANVSYFDGKAEFRQKIKILSKNFKIAGSVNGLTCSDIDGKCIPLEEDFLLNKLTIIEDENIEKVKVMTNSKANVDSAANNTIKTTQNSKTTAIDTLNNPTKKDEIIPLPNLEKIGEKVAITTNSTPETTEKSESLITFALLAFLGGLAALLTPCVFPMIPMTVSFFTSKHKKRSQGIFQAMFYGFSIIGIYTFIGFVVSRLFGADAANWLATHWIPNVLFFIIFLVFAFSFFGAYEIVMPHQLVNKIDEKSEKGGLVGVFFMAFTLVLVSFSCTGPIAGSILVASANGQILKPVIGMFAFSSAFAIPFTLFALFPSWLQSLPKSGGWLNSVKVVLGFIELALALKFLSTADQVYHWEILPRHIYLALWIAIFACMGLYLLGKIHLSHDSKEENIGTPRLILAILTFAFVAYLIPGLIGAPLKALAGYLPPQTSLEFDLLDALRVSQRNSNALNNGENSSNNLQNNKLVVKYGDKFKFPHGLQGYFDYNEALAASKAQSKPIFIDFTGHGCVNCREMEATVWSVPEVLQRLENDFILLALYVDDPTELPENEWITSKYDSKIKKTIGKINADLQITYFNNNAQPYYVVLGKNGLADKPLITPIAYNLDSKIFVDFLDKAKQAYK